MNDPEGGHDGGAGSAGKGFGTQEYISSLRKRRANAMFQRLPHRQKESQTLATEREALGWVATDGPRQKPQVC